MKPKRHWKISFLTALVAGWSACVSPSNEGLETIDYYLLPAYNDLGITAVIEIPAGTSHKFEYDRSTQAFKAEIRDGKERKINFLPYPANYGFIPSTIMAKDKGGDGDPLDVVVLCESVPTGTVMPVKPIGALVLEDSGELDTKVIAIPTDTTLRILKAESLQSLMLEYDGAQRILETWFLNYKGWGVVRMIGWRDEEYAAKEIDRWKIN